VAWSIAEGRRDVELGSTRKPISHLSNAFTARITPMAAVKGRAQRPAPQGSPVFMLQGRVSEAARNAAREAADEAGISIAAYLDALVLADAQHHFLQRSTRYHQEAMTA